VREVPLSFPFPRPATTVLVVDDQRFARRVAYRVLSEAGYRVLEAEDGEEALGALHISKGRVDLVLIDVVMPGMDGVELAGRIWEGWPNMRVLFTSGHAAEVLMQHGLAYMDVTFLAKPYTRDECLAKVREALQHRERRHTPREAPRQP
jgi:two-component system, cell cycle sensor histidine kinase and response regulator CckA